jgi:ParB-like chromosome segregation protein Spo0J
MSSIAIGFALEPVVLTLRQLLPSRVAPFGVTKSRKFGQIRASISEIGLIEPLVVRRVQASSEEYVVLDGHLRLFALQELGFSTVECLISKDDESYTYNNRVNRLATVQEHVMIRRAVAQGVPQERLANVLEVNVEQITKRLHLLDGICPEAIDLLKDREFSVELGRIIRKMRPTRQVECAELMLSANNLTLTYAAALLAATPASALTDAKKSRRIAGVTPEQLARMEREMTNLQAEYRLVEQTYGQDVLNLVLAQKYVARILLNTKVLRYLKQRYPEVLEQFAAIAETASLDT